MDSRPGMTMHDDFRGPMRLVERAEPGGPAWRAALGVSLLVAAGACSESVRGGGGGEGGDGAGSEGVGGATESSSPTTAATGESHPSCVEPDRDVFFSYQLDLEALDPATAEYEFQVDLLTPCTVRQLAREGETATLELACTHAERGEVPVSAELQLPADVALGLTAGQPVDLAYSGHGHGHHQNPGSYFGILDPGSGSLIVGGFDDFGVVALPLWASTLGGLSTELGPQWCPHECPDYGDCDFSYHYRESIVARHGEASVTVLDQHRGRLESELGAYEVVVGDAVTHVTIYAMGNFRVLIARAE